MTTRRDILKSVPLMAAALLSRDDAPSDIERELAAIRAKHGLPALAAVAFSEGRPTQSAVVGVRKHGDPTAATVTDRFHLGSCTKAMTAVLVAMLIEEKKLDWSTRLSELFTAKADELHEGLKAVTIDHLLAHRSGLSPKLHPSPRSLPALIEARRSPSASRRERAAYVARILKAKPEGVPGTAYAYCNVGYVILGAIVERLRDAPWEEVARRRIFEPLGMATAGFGPMGSPGKVDQPWQHRMREGSPVPVEPGPFSDNPPELGPAGTAHASVGDWARFLATVVCGGSCKVPLLKPATWKRLLTPQFGGEYAGGWIVTERSWGGRVLTHAGSNTMNYCVAWLSPERKLGVGIMTNIGGDTAARACDEAAAMLILRMVDRKDAWNHSRKPLLKRPTWA